MVLLFT